MQNRQRNKPGLVPMVLLAILCLLAFVLDLVYGSVPFSWRETLEVFFSPDTADKVNSMIISGFRLPKALTAILAGVALSVAGLQMQTVFRNPLAGPYVLGISAGASLGVALVVLGIAAFGFSITSMQAGPWTLAIAAWIGSGLVLMIILAVSLRIRDIMTILILGILFGAIASAVVSILQYFSNESMLRSYVIWTLGSLGNVTGLQLKILALSSLAGLLIVLFSLKALNALMMGESYARSVGIKVGFYRILIFISTSLLAGGVTAFCGPIGFIGIAVPHLTRLVFRTGDHRVLVPGTMLTGALVMLISDLISTLPGSKMILPVNSVTALIGIPMVIWIVLRNRQMVSV